MLPILLLTANMDYNNVLICKIMILSLCLFTYTADIVWSKNLVVMTQADGELAIFITLAALRLTVTAV